jgi:glycosyltransferase involved in cell wall biosynthesis
MKKPYKVALSQIMKNEAHVAERMLNSAKQIADCIVLVDTGSTDDTINVVKDWGVKNNIPVFVYERPFDDFDKCRNYAMEMVKDKAEYAFWLDFDEVLYVTPEFRKENLTKDLYMFETYLNDSVYTRVEMWRTDKKTRWYGPIHEFVVCDEPETTSDILKGIKVQVHMDGGSWMNGDVATKYKNHADRLEKYITSENKDPRWLFYLAQSYHDSAATDNKKDSNERLRRSLYYFKERFNNVGGFPEERYFSQFRIATIMMRLEEPWADVQMEALKAYNTDSRRAEPIVMLVEHYMETRQMSLAYVYSKFLIEVHHTKNPFPQCILFVDPRLYSYKMLLTHCEICIFLGKANEAEYHYKMLNKIYSVNKSQFTPEDEQKYNYYKQLIDMNKPKK